MESKQVSTSSGKYTPFDFFINSALPKKKKTLQHQKIYFNELFDLCERTKQQKRKIFTESKTHMSPPSQYPVTIQT